MPGPVFFLYANKTHNSVTCIHLHYMITIIVPLPYKQFIRKMGLGTVLGEEETSNRKFYSKRIIACTQKLNLQQIFQEHSIDKCWNWTFYFFKIWIQFSFFFPYHGKLSLLYIVSFSPHHLQLYKVLLSYFQGFNICHL